MAGVYFNLGRRKTQVEFIKILRRAALSNANPHQMQKFPHGFQNQALQILSEHCKRFFFFLILFIQTIRDQNRPNPSLSCPKFQTGMYLG